MDTNTIIKGLTKEFDMEGTKEFLKNFNIATKRVDKMSMFIGKHKNFTFMCNGQSLMGYMKREGDTTVQFTFRNLNELPWTNIYNQQLKMFIKQVVDKYFITNKRLMLRYTLIIEAAKNYDEIVLRALKGKVVKIQELRKPTQLLIAKKLDNSEVACDMEQNYSVPEPQENVKPIEEKKEEIKMTPMQLAHKIRRDEKLEGHYHAQMSYALKKAYAILNETESIVKDMSEDFNVEDEIAIDESNSKQEELTVQEVLDKYKGQYDAYVYFDGFNIHVNIKGKIQVLTTKYKGLRLEREFIAKLGLFKTLNKTLIIHHYDVFDPVENIDFIRIPC